MLRIALLAAIAVIALPSVAAEAAVLPSTSAGTLNISGDGAADQITLRLITPGTLRVDTGGSTFDFDRSKFTKIAIRSGAGDDTVRIEDPLSETTTIETGAGADTISGGPGVETISAGDDADLVQSGGGDDTVLLGTGDDTFLQGPGDGFDLLDGQSGTDALRTNGSDDAEEFTVQAFEDRILVNRDSGDVGLTMAGVEHAEVNAAGGGDLVDVGDLSPVPEFDRLDADLGLADGARDTFAAQATRNLDIADVIPLGEGLQVRGCPADLRVESSRAGEDQVTLSGGDGDDILAAGNGAAARADVTLDGGAGEDQLSGGAAVMRGGAARDVVLPGKEARVIDLGDGDDLLQWSSGQGNETVEGGAGVDEVLATSLSADDLYDVGPNGGRVRVTRNLGERLDIDGAEIVRVNSGGGADRIVTSNLAGTATTSLVVEPGGADLKSDTVFVNGTSGADTLKAVSTDNVHAISGAGAALQIRGTEPGDKLQVNGSSGDDTIDLTAMSKDRLQPFVDGGPGNDTIGGSPGQDVITGSTGRDFAFMGGGIDTFNWRPGDGNDIVEGQAGTDFLHMDGSAAAEKFDVSPVGSRTRVTDDVSSVVMDLGGVERLDVMPGAGNDFMHVADLSGTDTTHVALELAPFRATNSSDKNSDRVVIDGTFGNDSIDVTAGGPQVRVTGLAAEVITNRSDPTLDTMHIDSKPGADFISIQPAARNLLGITTA